MLAVPPEREDQLSEKNPFSEVETDSTSEVLDMIRRHDPRFFQREHHGKTSLLTSKDLIKKLRPLVAKQLGVDEVEANRRITTHLKDTLLKRRTYAQQKLAGIDVEEVMKANNEALFNKLEEVLSQPLAEAEGFGFSQAERKQERLEDATDIDATGFGSQNEEYSQEETLDDTAPQNQIETLRTELLQQSRTEAGRIEMIARINEKEQELKDVYDKVRRVRGFLATATDSVPSSEMNKYLKEYAELMTRFNISTPTLSQPVQNNTEMLERKSDAVVDTETLDDHANENPFDGTDTSLSAEDMERHEQLLQNLRLQNEAFEKSLSEQQKQLASKLTGALKSFGNRLGQLIPNRHTAKALFAGLLLGATANAANTEKTDAYTELLSNQDKVSVQFDEGATNSPAVSATDIITQKNPVVSVSAQTDRVAANRFADSITEVPVAAPVDPDSAPMVQSEEIAEVAPDTIPTVEPAEPDAINTAEVTTVVPATETVVAVDAEQPSSDSEMTPQFTQNPTAAEQGALAAPELTQEQSSAEQPGVESKQISAYEPEQDSNMWVVSEEVLADELLSQIPENRRDAFIDAHLKATESNESLKEAMGLPEKENGERSVMHIRPDRPLNLVPFIDAARALAYEKYIDQAPQTTESTSPQVVPETPDTIPSANTLDPLGTDTAEEENASEVSVPETQPVSADTPAATDKKIEELALQIEGAQPKKGFLSLFSGDVSEAPTVFSIYADTPMSELAQVTARELDQKNINVDNWNKMSDAIANMVAEGVPVQPDETLREYFADYIAHNQETA